MNHPAQLFVITLTKHRIFGLLLYPYFAEQVPGEPYMRLLRRVRQRDLTDPYLHFSAIETRLVKISERYSDETLSRKFCPDKPASELLNLIGKEEVKQKVLSYIEGTLVEILELLKTSSLPVYQKREKYVNLYEEDLINFCYHDTRAVFNFHRSEEETRYFLTLRNGEDIISLLKRNVEILVNEPCRVYYQNKIYFFDEISASKLLPFRDKEFISIPRKMEDRYYETFILNAIKCHEVNISGFEIRESTPKKEVTLSLEKDLSDMPVFVLYFAYNGVRLKMKKGEHRVVVLNKADQYIFDVFCRDLFWEESKLELLTELGLTGTAENLRLGSYEAEEKESAIYQSVVWITMNFEKLEKDGFVISQEGLSHPFFLGNYELQISVENKIDWFDLEIRVQIGQWNFPFIRFKRFILNGIENSNCLMAKFSFFLKAGFPSLTKSFPWAKPKLRK